MDTSVIADVLEIVVFAIMAVLSISFALLVVTAKDIVRSALSLIVVMFVVFQRYFVEGISFSGIKG